MIHPHERKRIWETQGVQVSNDKFLRCPFCSTIFAEGDYPDHELKIKCRRCGQYSTFQRLPK